MKIFVNIYDALKTADDQSNLKTSIYKTISSYFMDAKFAMAPSLIMSVS